MAKKKTVDVDNSNGDVKQTAKVEVDLTKVELSSKQKTLDIDGTEQKISEASNKNVSLVEKPKVIDVPNVEKTVIWNVPRFTLIIPCYNNAGYVLRCLKSIKAQTFDLNRVQVIAIDDASTDGSGDLLELVGNDIPDFTLIRNTKNIGVGASRNTALSYAKGKYIYFMDCDDYITERALERIDAALADAHDPDVAFIPFHGLLPPPKQLQKHKPNGTNFETALASCPTGPWTKVIKRTVTIPFPVGFRAEDTVWHFVQIDKFKTYCVVDGDEPCYVYDRTNTGAITETAEWSSKHALTLEHLALEDDAIKAGKNDKFFSDVLRALAEMYDSRHAIKNPFVKNLWFTRFSAMYRSMVCGHFHN